MKENKQDNAPQSFVNTNVKSGFNLGRFFNRKTFGLLVILILVAVIPLIVMISQKSQDIRQRAASSSNLLPANLQSTTFTNDPGAGNSGRVWPIPQQSTTINYVLSGTIENLSAKVRGGPYKAEIAVDIYDQYYPSAPPEGQQRYQNYDTRIISSSNASENISGPKTFTVNANYKAYLIFRTYNATANFKNVSLASKVTGPCYGRAAGACTFDTRTFNPAKNNREEITAYGKYWNMVDNRGNLAPLVQGAEEGYGDLTSIPRYSASNGPCAGKSQGQCKFNTRFFYTALNNHIMEVITANNGEYKWDNSDQFLPHSDEFFGYSWSDNDNARPTDYRSMYAKAPESPCYGKTNSDCVFDTQLVVRLNNRLIESVTAYGKGWNWDLNNLIPLGAGKEAFPGYQGFNLTSIDKYKNGPCAGKSGSDCRFETRTFAPNGWESITAYGKYFNFEGNNLVSSGDLTNVIIHVPYNKYSRVYDDRLNANILPSDLQNPTFTNDPGVGKYDIETSLVARTFTLSGALNNVAAKVGGVPYRAEVAVDIYDNLYPQQGHTALTDYKRIIKSNNPSEDNPSPLTFTVPANYKAFVLYRLYNATAKFENMSLTYDIPNTPTSTPVPTSTPIPQATSTPVPTNTPIPTIPAGSHAVSGKITSNGKNIQDVKVWILGDSSAQPKTVFTNHLGIFTAQIAGNANYSVRIYNNEPAGQATLAWWRKPGSTGTSDSYEQQPASGGCTPNCNFEISFSKQAISGRVTTNTPDHAGVSNLRVWISDISSASVYTGGFFTMATTDTNGNFSAQVAIGSHGYWVRIPNPDANHPDGDYNATLIVPLSGSAAYEQQPFTNTNRGCTPNCNFTADLKSTAVATNTPTPTTITYHLADFNHDQCVGTSDFNLWKDAYTHGQTPQSGVYYPNNRADLSAYVAWYNAMKNTSVNHCSN